MKREGKRGGKREEIREREGVGREREEREGGKEGEKEERTRGRVPRLMGERG